MTVIGVADLPQQNRGDFKIASPRAVKVMKDKLIGNERPMLPQQSVVGQSDVNGGLAVMKSDSGLPGAGVNRLSTKPEIANYLRVSVRTLEKMMRNGNVPFIKLNRTVRFRLEDVLECIRK